MLSDVGTVTDSESGIAVGVCTMSSAATLVDPDTVDDAITMCALDVSLFIGVVATELLIIAAEDAITMWLLYTCTSMLVGAAVSVVGTGSRMASIEMK